ncbi:hypothetical protein [Mesorhizobium sp. M1027]|uniref:hypothetical protein n=1 Tax=Mesorhizobium sp. M1027 TaxID=2957050 RepID=UPI003337E1EF
MEKGPAKLHSGMQSDDLITPAAVFHFSDSGTHRSILLNPRQAERLTEKWVPKGGAADQALKAVRRAASRWRTLPGGGWKPFEGCGFQCSLEWPLAFTPV